MQHSYTNYKGIVVPMATPVDANREIDVSGAVNLINYLLDHKVIPFIMGTTGEAPSLSIKNRLELVRVLVDQRREDIPLIAGVIGLPYQETVEQSNIYFKMGLDAVVVTLPNYYNLSKKQMLQFFRSVSEKVSGNVILYNIPSTVHMSLPVEVADELSQLPNIIGIKDSEFDERRLEASMSLWKNRKDFFHLTGVNKLMVRGLQLGSRGIVPSTANFAPATYHELYTLCLEEKIGEALQLLKRTQQLCDIYQANISLADSLAALKVVLSHLGICKPDMLPPLVNASDDAAKEIIRTYKKTIEV